MLVILIVPRIVVPAMKRRVFVYVMMDLLERTVRREHLTFGLLSPYL